MYLSNVHILHRVGSFVGLYANRSVLHYKLYFSTPSSRGENVDAQSDPDSDPLCAPIVVSDNHDNDEDGVR